MNLEYILLRCYIFVRRTLMDWAALIVIIVMIGAVRYNKGDYRSLEWAIKRTVLDILDINTVPLMEDPFPWEDVVACLDNEAEPAIKGLMCPKCGKELIWIRFYSPSWTWEKLCGTTGPLAICNECFEQVYYECWGMN